MTLARAFGKVLAASIGASAAWSKKRRRRDPAFKKASHRRKPLRPSRSEPFSVPDVLAEPWAEMVKENRLLEAKNDPLAAAAPPPPAMGAHMGADRHGSGPLLGLVSRAEGTDRPDGYDIVYGYDKYRPPGGKKLTDMTLDEVSAFHDEMRRRGSLTVAVGKYQIVGSTLRDLRQKMGLKGSDIMTAPLQDQLGEALAVKHGLYKVMDGQMTPRDFQKALSLEWSSLAEDASNKSAYPRTGPKRPARADTTEIQSAIEATRRAQIIERPTRRGTPAATLSHRARPRRALLTRRGTSGLGGMAEYQSL